MMKAQWEEVTTREGAPGPRSSHAVAVLGSSRVYLFGGELQPRVPVDSILYCFDLDTKAWSTVPAAGDVPAPRIGVTMAGVGSSLYVFGGRDAEHTELNELYAFDTLTGAWSLLSSGDSSPPARSYHAMTVDPATSTLFVFGGCGSQGRLNDLWAFSTAAKEWQALPLPPPGSACVPRGGPGLVAAAGSVWVLFGFCGHELGDVHRFDLSSKTWHQVTPLANEATWPSPRSVLGASAVGPGNDQVVIYGGEIDPSDLGHSGAGRFSDEVFLFDTRNSTWVKLEAQGRGPGRRGWFPTASLQSGILICGGNSESNDRLDDMFVLKLQ